MLVTVESILQVYPRSLSAIVETENAFLPNIDLTISSNIWFSLGFYRTYIIAILNILYLYIAIYSFCFSVNFYVLGLSSYS